MQQLTPTETWRAIILYGLNTATYKIALAKVLADFAAANRPQVSMPELSAAFLDAYSERLETPQPQLAQPGRQTVMERVVTLQKHGVLDRDEAIAMVERDAFNDVLPRFHTVAKREPEMSFFRYDQAGLALSDAAMLLLSGPEADSLVAEIDARWDLLEAAFAMKREGGAIANDIRAIYLSNGYERRSITHLRPVLHGYQHGRCFYCSQPISPGTGHVDHVIPRQFISHDEVWNLVLSHEECNMQKSDALPGDVFVAKLVARNEDLIASNHPLKQHLIGGLGMSPDARRRRTLLVYDDAKVVIRHTWQQARGYDPSVDPFYHRFIRSLGS